MSASPHTFDHRAHSARQGKDMDDAIMILDRIGESLPLRSIERDIVICAELYLMGDLAPGGTVARWWAGEGGGEWLHPGVLDNSNVERSKSSAKGNYR